jgi:hypothetical protein
LRRLRGCATLSCERAIYGNGLGSQFIEVGNLRCLSPRETQQSVQGRRKGLWLPLHHLLSRRDLPVVFPQRQRRKACPDRGGIGPQGVPRLGFARQVRKSSRQPPTRRFGARDEVLIDPAPGPSDRNCKAACKRELSVGRGSGIRTRDPLLPKQVLYQAELCPDISRTSARSATLRASSRLARHASPPPSSTCAPGSESRTVCLIPIAGFCCPASDQNRPSTRKE